MHIPDGFLAAPVWATLIGLVLGHRGRHHLFESDAHTLGDGGRRLDRFADFVRHLVSSYRTVS